MNLEVRNTQLLAKSAGRAARACTCCSDTRAARAAASSLSSLAAAAPGRPLTPLLSQTSKSLRTCSQDAGATQQHSLHVRALKTVGTQQIHHVIYDVFHATKWRMRNEQEPKVGNVKGVGTSAAACSESPGWVSTFGLDLKDRNSTAPCHNCSHSSAPAFSTAFSSPSFPDFVQMRSNLSPSSLVPPSSSLQGLRKCAGASQRLKAFQKLPAGRNYQHVPSYAASSPAKVHTGRPPPRLSRPGQVALPAPGSRPILGRSKESLHCHGRTDRAVSLRNAARNAVVSMYSCSYHEAGEAPSHAVAA